MSSGGARNIHVQLRNRVKNSRKRQHQSPSERFYLDKAAALFSACATSVRRGSFDRRFLPGSKISRLFSGIFCELGSGAVLRLSRFSDLLGIKKLSRERSGNEIVQSVADTHRKPVDASLDYDLTMRHACGGSNA